MFKKFSLKTKIIIFIILAIVGLSTVVINPIKHKKDKETLKAPQTSITIDKSKASK